MSSRRLLAVLLWSLIADAFIGPRAAVTAASAGARSRLTLVWAFVFSTATCLVLQEAAARLTVVISPIRSVFAWPPAPEPWGCSCSSSAPTDRYTPPPLPRAAAAMAARDSRLVTRS